MRVLSIPTLGLLKSGILHGAYCRSSEHCFARYWSTRAMPWTRRIVRLYLGYALGLLMLIGTILAAGQWAERNQLATIRERGAAWLDLQTAVLQQELARYHYLPAAIRLNSEVEQLLVHTTDSDLSRKVDRFLKALNRETGTSELYVLNLDGKVVAASNWDEEISFIGIDLSYRPYFQDALRTGVGRLYGIGTTTGEPGYYFAQAIVGDNGKPLGVATVKVSLDRLESPWAKGPGPSAMVVDSDGVVILTSESEWKYRTLAPLSADTIRRIQASRQFERASLTLLDMRTERDLGDGVRVISLQDANNRHRHDLLLQERSLATAGWRMISLSELDDVAPVTRGAQAVAGFGLGSLMLLGLYLRQRRQALRFELAAKKALERANVELEQKVAERTRALLAAQNKLVHTGTLAALGQMAASVTHELNQPLAALRTLSDNTRTLLQRQRTTEAETNLDMIGQIVGRMAQITAQLKVFARKPTGVTGPIAIKPSIDYALMVVESLVQRRRREMEDADARAVADAARLEQVLVNLLSNAVDAIGNRAGGQVTITVTGDVERAAIAIADNGPGILPELLPNLFEPFVTTKDAGGGLGLGLTICEGIIRDFGGRLRARNLPGGGAEFVIEMVSPNAVVGGSHG
jgi:two-component system, NtrC family, C4-dicarboxylate transport sensor histidine kinase DctB